MFSGWYDISQRKHDFYKTEVSTAQRAWEFEELGKIYDELQPMRVLEIGSWYGGTLHYWITHAPAGAVIGTVDNLLNDMQHTKAEVLEKWNSWVTPDKTFHAFIGQSDNPEIIQGVKDELSPLDFIFIDGGHTYDIVKADFDNYGPLVRKGGIIALHDITMEMSFREPEKPGVKKLWTEIKQAGYITRELRIDRNTCGIGVVYV
jgi:cephalosporin hydroxylase